MIWDACLTAAFARELSGRLSGGRARALAFDREGGRVGLYLRESTLVADLSAGAGWITLSGPQEPDEGTEPVPAVVSHVEAVPDERILMIGLRRVRGRKPDPTLILDLTTNRWSALLCEGPKLTVRKRLRVIEGWSPGIGRPWSPPGPGSRVGVGGDLDAARWRELAGTGPVAERRRRLLRTVAYTSPLNVPWLIPDEGSVAEASVTEGFTTWRRMALAEGVAPHLMDRAGGPQPYPWPLPAETSSPVPSLLDAMEAVRLGADAGDAPSLEAERLGRALAGEERRLRRKRRRLQDQLGGAERAGRLRELAGLILSSLDRIPAGSSKVTLTGFDGEPMDVALDPAVRPQDHADKLFKRATRLERAAEAIPEHIAVVEGELERLADLRGRVEGGALSAEDRERLGALAAEGQGSQEGPTLPYRVYRSSGGLEIRVGRSAKRNDELTFHHTRPDDVWLHARHASGAHVVLRWVDKGRPPAADLGEAATLAANFSRARTSGRVPVDWTRRKWVRKPKGAPPGTVVLQRVQTLFVTPDPELSDRLEERK